MDNSNSETHSKSSQIIKPEPEFHVASMPTVPRVQSKVVAVLPKKSAPSYLFSLSENPAPPFVIPVKEPKSKLLIGCGLSIMTAEDAVEMIAVYDADRQNGLKTYLSKFLVEKKVILNYSVSERNYLITFIGETIDYAAQRDFSAAKLACLITIYLTTHMYFRWYYWLPAVCVWSFFRETMIRHTIEDSPDGQEVFEPQECFDILTHFHTNYMNNLPLIHLLTFGSYRIKLVWPYKNK